MNKIRIEKAGKSLVAPLPGNALNSPVDFYGYVFCGGKRVGTLDVDLGRSNHGTKYYFRVDYDTAKKCGKTWRDFRFTSHTLAEMRSKLAVVDFG